MRNFVVISPNKPVAKKLEPGGHKIYRLVSSSASQLTSTNLINSDSDLNETRR